MAIFSRYGTPIKSVEWFDEGTGECGVVADYGEHQKARVFHSSDMRADGGINEIVAAAKTIRDKDGKAKPTSHTHQCSRCRAAWECGNEPGCDLGEVHGFCSQECYKRGSR